MNNRAEKRRRLTFSDREQEILRWLFIRGFFHVLLCVALSLIVLFFGLKYLMSQVSFGSYGLNPSLISQNVQRFISAYFWIALANIVLISYLSVALLYMIQKRFIQPIGRITKDLEERFHKSSYQRIAVRKDDTIIYPLVELINKLMAKSWRND